MSGTIGNGYNQVSVYLIGPVKIPANLIFGLVNDE
jgi:hypothetical protein